MTFAFWTATVLAAPAGYLIGRRVHWPKPTKYVVWRAGAPLSAILVKGSAACAWRELALAFPAYKARVVPVNDMTLAGLSVVKIAEIWEELLVAHGKA